MKATLGARQSPVTDRADAPPPQNGLRSFAHGFAREAGSVVFVAAALYAALALASFQQDPIRPEVVGADWVGPVGAGFAYVASWSVGILAWYVPIECCALAVPLLWGNAGKTAMTETKGVLGVVSRMGGNVVVVTILASLAHIAMPTATVFGGMPFGGAVGELCGEVLRSLFSSIGSFIIGLTVVTLILVGRASFSFVELVARVRRTTLALAEKGAWSFRSFASAWARAKELEAAPRPPVVTGDAEAIIAAIGDEGDARAEPPSERLDLSYLDDAETPFPVATQLKELPAKEAPSKDSKREPKSKVERPAPKRVDTDDVPTPSPIAPAVPSAKAALPAEKPAPKPRPKKKEDDGIRIVDPSAAMATEKADKIVPAIGEGFRLPGPELLDPPETQIMEVNQDQLHETAQLLEKTLSDYGVSGKVEEIHPGPTVTTFEVSPAAGTKVSKVASLADDLALGLSRKVRIIAPIAGKNRIGFEIPNPKRMPVNMRELVEDRRFVEMKSPLPCVLGRDIVGAPYFADLASMPHMIVAGATGAGKSVGLNVVLVSLLTRRTPDELRLLMIDPKVVELAPYDGIPHMLLPVVTDMKQASNALRWAVDEMERRYQLFANAGTKNITTYNGFVERVLRGEAKAPKPLPTKVAAVAPDGTEVTVDPAKDGSDVEPPIVLPSIVIVVDEFADLMMQQGKDVETSVARLAQKARAAGMHVILATQRPSVDVITGMIKANFPTRIAFRVAQKVDSRTILDEQGAEHLLGRGDMLVKMNGSNEMRRVQCPFISEEETQRVCDFLRLQGKPEYDENILKPRDEDGAPDEDDAEADPMYDQAVRIVAETRRCSTSWIQRKLGIGYNRAAKIVEMMEKRGLVGPSNGAKDREVLVEPI